MEKDILAKIRKLRKDKNIEPLEIANHLGIDISSYNRMENGVNSTWGKYILRILDFLEVSPSDFFKDLEGKNFIHQEVDEIKEGGQNIGLVESFNQSEAVVYMKLIDSLEKTVALYEDRIKHLEALLESKT